MNKRLNTILLTLLAIVGVSLPAAASYLPFNTNVNMNVGIGTSTPQGAFVVVNGNVGIGTWTAKGGNLIVNGGGNVGIGSAWPGQALDVNGTVRMTGFTLTGNGAASGNVLIGNGVGVGTWMPASTLMTSGGTNYWLNDTTGNVGISTIYAVGIGTSFVGGTGEASFAVMNGNVGIGTWVPGYELETEGGSVGIGVNSNTSFLQIGQLANSESVPNGLSLKDYITSTASNQSEAEVDAIVRAVANTGNTYFGIIGDTNNNLASAVNYTASIGLVGVGGYTTSSGSGVISGVASIYAGNSSYTGSGGGITNAYGVFISDQTAATNNYGIYSGITSGLNKWNFYGNGTAPNYFNGNVGIGSLSPGQALDVNGTVRMTGFALTGNGAANGNVLVGNSVGVGTWMPASTLLTGGGTNYWLNDTTGNVGISTIYAVGIGTSFVGGTGEAAFSVMNGNVGIGTWLPAVALEVEGGLQINSVYSLRFGPAGFAGSAQIQGQGYDNNGDYLQFNTQFAARMSIDANGNIGIGTTKQFGGFSVMNGNVGIGTWVPNGALDIKTGNNVLVESGNVGIGTLVPGTALDVIGTVRMTGLILTGNGAASGNVLVGNGVGVGTWMPASTLLTGGGTNYWLNDTTGNVGISTVYAVGIGTSFVGGTGEAALSVMKGNVGIGTWVPQAELDAEGTGGIILNSGNVGINTTAPSALLTVNGASILGFVNSNADFITSSGKGAFAGGYAYHTFGSGVSGSITSSGNGNFAFGSAQGLSGTGNGSIIASSGVGNIAMGAGSVGTLESIGGGSIAMGLSTQGTLEASNEGSVAMGFADEGTVQSSGFGSIAMGFVGTGGTLQATQQGSIAIGDTVQATGTDSTALGANVVNSISSTLMIGFNPTPTLTVTATNVGIGTFNPFGGGLIVTNGNVGIGSLAPGQAFDVHGTVRTIGFTMSGQTPVSGYVLTSSDSSGDTTWSPSSSVGTNYWLNDTTGNVGISTIYAVGIGTSFVGGTGEAALSVMNGNVGIGTWVPALPLDINGAARMTGFTLTGNGASPGNVMVSNGIGVGTWMPTTTLPVGTLTAGTTNQVAYYSGTLTLSSNSAMVFNAPNVGLGTVTPLATLQVVGNIGIGTVANGDKFITTSPPKGGMIVEGNVGIGTWVPAGALIVANGNVGIGVPNPAQSLEVNNGYVQVDGGDGYKFGGGAGSNGSASVTGSGYDNAADYIGFATQYLTRMTLNANGNLGIGSTNPGQLLDVQGTVRTIGLTMSGQTPISGYVLTSQDSGGDATWSSPGTVGGWTVSGNNVYETSGGNVGIGTTLLTTSALTVMNGNVGIGTWVPGSALRVVGNAGIGAVNPWTTFTVTGAGLLVGSTIHLVSANDDPTGSFGVWLGYDSTGTIGVVGSDMNGSTSILALATANSTGTPIERMWIDGAGNVGIGTTTPAGGLAVMNGNVGIGTWVPNFPLSVTAPASGADETIAEFSANIGVGSSAHVYINNTAGASNVSGELNFASSGTPKWGMGNDWFGNGGQNFFIYDDVGAALRMFINPSGNVGIGSVDPIQMLDVNGTVRSIGLTMSGQTPISGYVLTSQDSNGDATWSSPGTVGGWTVSGNNVYETSGGNVGIGTTLLTTSALTVMNGNVGIGTWIPGGSLIVKSGNVGIGSDNTPDATLEVTQLSGTPPFMVSSTVTTSGDYLSVINGGNVGIGSTAPGKTLDVQGTVRALGEIVNGNVGIGTINASAALSIMNGNVGIGTWNPRATLDVEGPLSTISLDGNVGIGTLVASNLLTVNGNMVANGSILTNPNGSTNAAPRLFGFSPAFSAGQAAQIQFGDNNNIIQNGYGERMQLSAYWGIEIHGNYEAVAEGFVNGADTDPSLSIFAPSADATATASTLAVLNTGGTATYDVIGQTGNVGIGTSTTGNGSWVPSNGFVYNNCAAHSGQAACWTTHGAAGYCTTVVSAAGACTCTAC